ncbi:MAG: ATP-binding cassette domain-containing protein [Pseudomonadota bacterium]
MLQFKGLKLQQGDFALSADTAFASGHITALIGPSGAGKSTLLAAIAGFLTPTAGDIFWNGNGLGQTPPGNRPVSILFQDNNLFPHLTAAQNVGLGLVPSLRLSSAQLAEVTAALEAVGLAGFHARKPHELSGGQQSRVALARILVADRPLILLDEPFAALGPALKEEMLDIVAAKLLKPEKCIIMGTHDPADARRTAGMAALVADGHVHRPQKTTSMLDDPPPVLAAYLGNNAAK